MNHKGMLNEIMSKYFKLIFKPLGHYRLLALLITTKFLKKFKKTSISVDAFQAN